MNIEGLEVAIPLLPHPPVGDELEVHSDYYRSAALNIRYNQGNGTSFAGSGLTEAVAQLCESAAASLRKEKARRESPADPKVNESVIDFGAMVESIRQHRVENPTHGTGCACMDEHARTFRRAIYATQRPLYSGTMVDPEDGLESNIKADDYELETQTRDALRGALYMVIRSL